MADQDKRPSGTGNLFQFARSQFVFFAQSDLPQLIGLAGLVGILAAYAILGLRLAIDSIRWVSFGTFHENLTSHAATLPWWQILIAPVIGGLVVGLLLQFIHRPKRPLAVQDAIEGALHDQGRMSWRDGLTAALISAVSLGAGASAGREGPAVHLGASLAGGLVARLNLSPAAGRILLASGVAAAVAASFNAPLAGALFATEVILGFYAARAFAAIAVASVAGTIICRLHLGNGAIFDLPDYVIGPIWEYGLFALLGILCGLVAIAFMTSIIRLQEWVENMPLPLWSTPALAGLIIGAVGIFYPQVLGVGFEATQSALRGDMAFGLLITLVGLKFFTTTLTLSSRFGGGIFSPAMFLGAVTGGAFAAGLTILAPDLELGAGLYAIVGMGALAGAVLGAPISTILIAFELTGDYQLATGVMVATVFATAVTQGVVGRSFFHWQLERRGLFLRPGTGDELATKDDK